MVENTAGQVVLCKSPNCKNPVAKVGRRCDPCYLELPGSKKECPTCKALIHSRQRECARHMLDLKGGVTRRPRENISTETKRLVFERDSYTCQQCGTVGKGSTHAEKKVGFEIDHILANAIGGGPELTNLRVLCRKCNRNKWLN